ncbi:MAG: GNAT family N-acetyltransferase [Anaerolineae bacterium]|nr:GNAT family N-acetyltransferase [Anaerolineae bacterium]
MSTLSIQVRSKFKSSGVRPVDPRHDMRAVVDLIGIGFGEELDPQGLKILQKMQQIARRGTWAQIYPGSISTPSGFVWVTGRRVVGNLSLRRAFPYGTGGWLIGNVVVHPDYRGRGISRALMDAAINAARDAAARWVGLEVRVDNDIARGLYERLGFTACGQTQHMIRPDALPWPAYSHPQRAWQVSRPRDASTWTRLADMIYTPNQRRVLETHASLYTFGGWFHKLELWFSRQRDGAWVQQKADPRLAVHVRTDYQYRFHLWDILVHPDETETGAGEALARAFLGVRRYRPWPIVAVTADQPFLVGELEATGFQCHRTLLQMILTL